jgi:ribosomal protein S18 acetylase RimI-like enzyme
MIEDSRARPDGRPTIASRVEVRPGHAEDFDPAFALWRKAESARRDGPPPSVSVERVLGYARRSGAFLQVADSGGELVGMALVTPASSRPGEVAVVQMVFVAPERWGEGIGGKLVAAALGEAKTRGFERAQLWAHADDERACRLYEGRGFGPRVAGESGELSCSTSALCNSFCGQPPSKARHHEAFAAMAVPCSPECGKGVFSEVGQCGVL